MKWYDFFMKVKRAEQSCLKGMANGVQAEQSCAAEREGRK